MAQSDIEKVLAVFAGISAQGMYTRPPGTSTTGGFCNTIRMDRVENEKVVEHWGFPEMLPPPAEWKNSNGML